MKKQKLRFLTDKYHRQRLQEKDERTRTEKEEIFSKADVCLREAATGGLSSAVIYTVHDFREDLIYLPPECEYSCLEDSDETIKLAKRKLAALDIDCLRGTAAELRDYYEREGLILRLQMRVEGNTCNSVHYVWDIIAEW